MKTRQTSIDCYNQIKEEGLLSKRRMEVFEAIYNLAPCTSAEAINTLPKSKSPSQARARFTELRELGVIYEKGERTCTITGRNVIEWDLTDNLPIKGKVIKNTKKIRVENALKGLRKLYKNKTTASDEDWRNVASLIKDI